MVEVLLTGNERIDDLMTFGLKIIQSDEVFSFSLDAVLLARFCSVPPRGNIIDLCTGNAVIPLLLSTRTPAAITGVEIQERLAEMGSRNIVLNHLEQQIRMIHADLKTIHQQLGYGKYDLVTVNPPYLPVTNGEQNIKPHYAAARHELLCTLDDVVSASAKLVRAGGKVAMVHRAARLAEVISTLKQYRLEPKRIRFVHPRLKEEANMVLIEAMKDSKPEVRLLSPLIVYNHDNTYCDELMKLYYTANDGNGKMGLLSTGGQATEQEGYTNGDRTKKLYS